MVYQWPNFYSIKPHFFLSDGTISRAQFCEPSKHNWSRREAIFMEKLIHAHENMYLDGLNCVDESAGLPPDVRLQDLLALAGNYRQIYHLFQITLFTWDGLAKLVRPVWHERVHTSSLISYFSKCHLWCPTCPRSSLVPLVDNHFGW